MRSIPPAQGGFRMALSGSLILSGCTPPACGGYQALRMICTGTGAYSPRIRGLSDARTGNEVIFLVFPPCAGVIGENGNLHKNVCSIPPACGGYRRYRARRPRPESYSPPRTGVIGESSARVTVTDRIPPVCGGYRDSHYVRYV